MAPSKLWSCAVLVALLAILVTLSLTNTQLFLVITDVGWNILNYLDNSQAKFDGNVFVHSKPYAALDTESIDYNLKVTGQIPSVLDGVMFKIGPNSVRQNIAIRQHWFDGDGMVHSIRFISQNNTAHYSNAFMRTPRYIIENERLKRSVYFNFFGSIHHSGVTGLLKMFFGRFVMESKFSPVNIRKYEIETMANTENVYQFSTANTNILHWNHRLFALLEANMPLEIKYDSQTCALETVSFYNFTNSWNIPFTAHPKIDRRTNQLFTHGVYLRPGLDTIVIGITSAKDKNVIIASNHFQLKAPTIMHDMIVTDNYILVFDCNLHIGKEVMKATKGKRLIGFDETQKSKIGILNRKELESKGRKAEIEWIDIEPCFVFHFVNGYETDSNEIIVTGNRFQTFDFSFLQFSTYNLSESYESVRDPFMYEWRIDLETKTVKERVLSLNIDGRHHLVFGVINPLYGGKRNRFMWAMLYYMNDTGIIFDGFIKYDFEKEKVVGTIMFGETEVGNSEFEIVPKEDIDGNLSEDEVFVSGFIYDSKTDKSRVEVFDGQSMSAQSIATVQLLRRVPIGFHSQFVSEKDLQKMQ